MATLKALTDIISSGIAHISADCGARGHSYPTLDDAYDTRGNTVQNTYAAEAAPVIAACWQLIATLTHPSPYLVNWAYSGYYSSCIAAVSEACIPDILREASSESESRGMHVREISAVTGLNGKKLESMLRFLAAKHIFVEVSPSVFANNRMSAALCVGKSVSQIRASPLEKWDGTNGISAYCEALGKDANKLAASLPEYLTDEKTAHTEEPTQALLHHVFKTDLTFWNWMELPENTLRRKRFHNAMSFMSDCMPSVDVSSTDKGFDWGTLPANSTVVDVAGGIGLFAKEIAVQYPQHRYVVQDLPEVIEQAKEHWELSMPAMLSNGVVSLQAQDFFEKQPDHNLATVFVLRLILHTWPDEYCRRILTHLRAAAGRGTHLVVIEDIVDYLSRGTPDTIADVPGAGRAMAPVPLLPYPDAVCGFTYGMNMQMMGHFNSSKRTLGGFDELFRGTGWKLERVHRFPPPQLQQLVCAAV